MRVSFPMRRVLRSTVAVVVWSGSIAGAFFLYRMLGGPSEAVAIAEAREYRVAPARVGRVASLEVAQGDCVSAGQIVARLDTELLNGDISVAEAQLRQSASQVNASGVSLDASVLQVERGFRSEVESANVEMEAARAEQSRDRGALARIDEDVRRERDLVRRGLTKADRLAAMELHRASLEENVRNWPGRIAAIERRRDAAASRLQAWHAAHPDGPDGSRSMQLRPVQEKVDERRQSLQRLRTRLDQTVLRATSTACVSVVHARPGDVLRAGEPVVTLVETKPRQVIGYVEEHRASTLARGMKVNVRRRNSSRDSVPGSVVAVASDVTMMPQRTWPNPHVPTWGRMVYISVPDGAALAPGEMLDVARPGENGGVAKMLASLRPTGAVRN